MKKNVIALLMLAGFITMYACKGHKKDQADSTSAQPAAEKSSAGDAGTDTKTYVVTLSPDTVSLGKNKEAFVKLTDVKAIELSNADGTAAGTELSYKIELTNKNAIGGNAVGLATTDFRLELDNGNKIAPSSTFVSAEPEATKLSDYDKFMIPAGAKPKALNLFFDQTRASIKLELK